MKYLAICLARVLKRNASSHPGKLDRGNETAGMIVVMFYSLYRYKSAEEFQESIDQRLQENGALDSLGPIELPFLDENGADLPKEMEEILTEALQLQVCPLSSVSKIVNSWLTFSFSWGTITQRPK